MAPGRRRGAKRVKTKEELNLGDLVLAKIKGFPAWPAKISRPEDWEHLPDPKKYFVQFFGTSEIAFVAPADIQSFTSDVKNKLSARCQGKKVRYFAQAVKEICEEFEQLQHKNSTVVRDDESTQAVASQAHPFNPGVDEHLEHNVNNGTDIKGQKDDLEIKGSSELEHCLQEQGEVDFQEVKPCLSDGVNPDVLPSVYSRKKKKKLSTDHTNVASNSVSVSSSHDIKREGMFSDVGHRELINGRKQKLATGSKKGSIGGLDASEGNFEEHNGSAPKKKMNAKNGCEKQKFRTDKSSTPTEMSKCADAGNDMVGAHLSRKNDSKNPKVLEDKMISTRSKRLTSGCKTENRSPDRVQTITNEANHSADENDLPPTKRRCRALGTTSSSALLSEKRLESSISHKKDLAFHNKVSSSVVQLPKKRRAVRLCDDEDDESPKTPVHGGFAHKASVIPCAVDSQEKHIMHGKNNVENQLVLRNSDVTDNGLKEQEQSVFLSNKALSPAAQHGIERRTGELCEHVCPSSLQEDTGELCSTEAKPVLSSPMGSPQSVGVSRPSAELQSNHCCKAPVNASLKKIPAGESSGTAVSGRSISIINQSVGERSKSASGEKKKTTPKSDIQSSDHVLAVGTKTDSTSSLGESKDDKTSSYNDSKRSSSVLPMKHLIAAAQARKRQAHSHSSYGNPLLLFPEADLPRPGLNPSLAEPASESNKMLQVDVRELPSTPPFSHLHQVASSNQNENEDHLESRVNSEHQVTVHPLSGGTEAGVARDAFEGMIETLSRTKESIGRATRLAIDCAKYGIANEVVELLIQKLENESSLHRRVDLFFLVDSITQCSHTQRGVAGASYIPIVQAVLPRLIGAVAPAGTSAQENHRQCRKVLRLWLERKILPESVLRHYMDVLGVVNDDSSSGFSSRRPSRAERAFDDPIREMEGMVVDEYGSNTTFKLPGLLSANLFDEEDYEDSIPKEVCEDDDGASPTKLASATSSYPMNHTVTPNDQHHCVLKDVDGELEMEDVSGHRKDERPLFSNHSFECASLKPNSNGILELSSNKSAEWLPSSEGSPPLPPGSPPVTPPLPASPPPSSSPLPLPPAFLSSHLLPPPPPPPPSSQQHLYPQAPLCPPPAPVGPQPPVGLAPPPPVGPPAPVGLALPPVGLQAAATHLPSIVPPPPSLSQQSYPIQPQFMVHHMPPLPSTCTHGPHVDGCVRTDVQSKQVSCVPPSGVNSAREHVANSVSRHVDYGQGDAYMNPHALQHQQQSGCAPLARRPVHTELPPRGPPGHFSYLNSVQEHQYAPCSMPSFSDDPRRYAIDEPWRMQVNELNEDYHGIGWVPRGRSCSAQPYSHEGYFGPPPERPLSSTVNFQHPAPNNLPPAPHYPVYGGSMMPNRPDLFGVNQ